MQNVTVRVMFHCLVPDGVDPDDLCLHIETDTVDVMTVDGTVVAGAKVEEYETTETTLND